MHRYTITYEHNGYGVTNSGYHHCKPQPEALLFKLLVSSGKLGPAPGMFAFSSPITAADLLKSTGYDHIRVCWG